ncbi:mitochondrial import inner membrane translocase subunit TIM22-3 isoform X2 [Vigna radiata var. radiata]|uniref:Mitochondrial import inner membrane translocase subunit TIM22-3 isoform X2 n=1 Tax=Vigna radiata var. radiata TaxID=3916 RepID=A0A3Q0FFJ0_VIGRR|nr:mitochondrial import inner membrane translocase subunit TIM22-3 isoform X2 [Vigna radiata var. radiata]
MASNATVNSESDVNSAPSPTVCLLLSAANSACSAFAGSLFGYGAGLIKKKGFKGSFIEAGSNAKTFAILSGVDSLAVCIFGRLRGKDDDTPLSLLQNCLTLGVLSFIVEGLTKQGSALAYPKSKKTVHNKA